MPDDPADATPPPSTDPAADPRVEADEPKRIPAEEQGRGVPVETEADARRRELAETEVDSSSFTNWSRGETGAIYWTTLERCGVFTALVLMVAVLWVGRPILLPMALAALLSFLLSPVCDFLERYYVPRVAAVVAVVAAVFVVLGGMGFAVYTGINHLATVEQLERLGDGFEKKAATLPFQGRNERVEQIQETIEEVGERISRANREEEPASQPASQPTTAKGDEVAPAATQGALARTLAGIEANLKQLAEQQSDQGTVDAAENEEGEAAQAVAASEEEVDPLPVRVIEESTLLDQIGYAASMVVAPIGMAALVIIFVLFILLARDDLRDRLIKLTAGTRINLATQALDDAAGRISRYLRAQCIINGTYGVTIGIGLLVIGWFGSQGDGEWLFPGVAVWALLCFALRFIPYLGPWLAAIFPLVVSLGYYDGYSVFLATAGMFVVVELISNNVMEPWLYGVSTGMSEIAVIMAATFWTFVWGPVGLLVATPLTTCIVVLGKYVPGLRFFDILLGDEPVLTPQSRFYQRLLALDDEDALEVATDYRDAHSLTATYDEVLLPALAMAEQDRHAGNLQANRVTFIRRAVRDVILELGEQKDPSPHDSVDLTESIPDTAAARQASVVILPVSDDADEMAGLMLTQLLQRRGYHVTMADDEELTSEKLEAVFASRAEVVVVSAVPPRATSRARYLLKKLSQAQSERGQETAGTSAAVIVGLWTESTSQERKSKVTERLGAEADNIRVVGRLEQALVAIRQRAEVVASRRSADVAARVKASARGNAGILTRP